ncbi:MAG: tetratricopeptide repeat protein [Bacteroidota bacterium]
MRLRWSWIYLVGFAQVAQAQLQGQARVDSLLNHIRQTSADSTKIELYVDLLTTYNTFNRPEGLNYEAPALALAEKMNSPAAVAAVKNAVGRLYWREGRFDLALKYHHDALRIYDSLRDRYHVALSNRYLGQDYGDAGNFPEALRLFTLSLQQYESINDHENQAYLQDLLAWVHGKMGNYVDAARHSFLAMEQFEIAGDTSSIAMAAATVAENYLLLGNHREALRYFERSYGAYMRYGDRINQGYSLCQLGKVTLYLNRMEESMNYYQQALATGNAISDFSIVGTAYEGLAEWHGRADLAMALRYYLLAAEAFKKGSNQNELARIYIKMGKKYVEAKDIAMAGRYYQEAYSVAQQLKSKTLLTDYYLGQALLDSATGNWQAAFRHYQRHVQLRDSLFNQDHIRQMVQLQLGYEFDKREAATRAQQQERSLRQQRQTLFVGIIAALVFVLALVLYLARQRVARINQALDAKSRRLEEENREKSSILNIVSHDLIAPFNKIKGLTDLMQRFELSQQERKEYLAYIQASVEQGTHLIRNLLESQNVQENAVPVPQKINLSAWGKDFQASMAGTLHQKQQSLLLTCALTHIDYMVDNQMLTRILDNLVSNASKFSASGKNIHLKISQEDSQLRFSVRDEGPGISAEEQPNMFRRFQKLSARPTAGEGSSGLGLSIVKTLVDCLNGHISVTSSPGAGTEIVVSIPAVAA